MRFEVFLTAIIFLFFPFAKSFSQEQDNSQFEMKLAEHEEDSYFDEYQDRSMRTYRKEKPKKIKKFTCPYPYSYASPLQKGYVYLEGEWLYWEPSAEIPFADVVTIRRFAPTTTQEYADDDKEIRNHYKFKTGYRGRFGINFPYSGWNFFGQYQRLTNNTRKNVDLTNDLDSTTSSSAGDRKALFPYWTNAGTQNNATYKWIASFSKQKIRYQVADGILNKTFYVLENFALTPSVGARSAWIRNQLDVTYTGVGATNVTPVQDLVRLQNNFYGWGIRSGLQSNWIVGGGFEFFGKMALSNLLGKLVFRQRENFIDIDSSDNSIRGSSHRETTWRTVMHVIELGGGINWGLRFYKDKLYLGFKGGYELNLWPNFIRLNRYAYQPFPATFSLANYSNTIFAAFENHLIMQGYTASLKLEF